MAGRLVEHDREAEGCQKGSGRSRDAAAHSLRCDDQSARARILVAAAVLAGELIYWPRPRSSHMARLLLSLSRACAVLERPAPSKGEIAMSNTSKRVEGAVEELGGRVKAGVGAVLGNDRLELEGRAAALKGKVKQEVSKALETVKGKIQEVAGSVKSAAGELADDDSMQAEGKTKELEGEARQALNR
jgi:uncharacterized protein YjbJ (UPF0337 family)